MIMQKQGKRRKIVVQTWRPQRGWGGICGQVVLQTWRPAGAFVPCGHFCYRNGCRTGCIYEAV